MDALLTQPFLTSLLFGAVTAGMPLLLAGLGEQISEKAGVLNIGIEGMMLAGAYAGFVAAYYSGSFALGFLAGAARRHGGGVAGGAALHPPRPQPDRHRHRAHARRRGADRPAPLCPVQPHLSAACRGAGAGHPRPRRHPGARARACSATIRWSISRSCWCSALAWLFRATYLGLNLEAAGNKPAALDAAGVDVVRDPLAGGAGDRRARRRRRRLSWPMSGPGSSCPS